MYGQGLIKGLSITLKHFFEKKITQQYPEERPKCIACGICSNQCPNNVIKLNSEKDENNKKKLTGYEVMLERCLFCGFCVEACPTKALLWTKDFELTKFHRDDVNLDLFNSYVPSPEDTKPAKEDSEQASKG